MEYLNINPRDIEKKSMEMIGELLGGRELDDEVLPVVKRVIHATADFDFADTLFFSKDVIARAKNAMLCKATLITDTNMALAGINKQGLASFDMTAHCFMVDQDVAVEALSRGLTRASVSMEHSALLPGEKIYAVGNAPTALLCLDKMIKDKILRPALIIAVPVGFVNVEYAKELIRETCLERDIPIIAAMGRKGGSTVCAAIVNALLYHDRVRS